MFGRNEELARQQKARDYVVHHAARYGWGPPVDVYQALVVVAARIWEVVLPDRFEHTKTELQAMSRDDANDFAARTFAVGAAITAFTNHKAGNPNADKMVPQGLVSLLADEPWELENLFIINGPGQKTFQGVWSIAYLCQVQDRHDLQRVLDRIDED